MIADLRPYPEYKESGLPWLGSVPVHWHEWRLDRLFEQRNETPVPDDQRVTGYLSGRVTLRSNVHGQKIKGVIKDGGWKRVYPGDFAISGMNAHLGGMGVSDSLGKCSPIYIVLKPKRGTNAHFVSHAVRHIAHTGALKSFVNTIRFNSADFKRDALKLFRVLLPDEDEQAAIVRFVDSANGRLERAIRAKRKVIALLNEKKQAIIHRAVTRGLDPSVPLKPSGIPWLGDIPKRWSVLRSKYIFREVDSRSTTGEETHLSMSQKMGLIPSSLIEEKRLVSESYVGAKLCEKGDLVLNRLKAHLGVFALAPERGLISPDYTVFRPVRELEARYFEAVYRTPACRVELRRRAKGIVQGFWRLYTDDFYDIRMPVPSVDEQKCIMAQLDIDLSGVKTAVTRLEREITLLREYRTRLVADVVTGKLDVRAVAHSLPVEAEEPAVAEAEDLSDENDSEADLSEDAHE